MSDNTFRVLKASGLVLGAFAVERVIHFLGELNPWAPAVVIVPAMFFCAWMAIPTKKDRP